MSNMPKIVIVTGIILILLGVGTFAVTGAMTALIPSLFGILLVVCGFIARDSALRKHAMHGAAVIALLGSAMPAVMVIRKVSSGKASFSSAAILEQTAMAVICTVLLVACVRSFIAARKARQSGEISTMV